MAFIIADYLKQTDFDDSFARYLISRGYSRTSQALEPLDENKVYDILMQKFNNLSSYNNDTWNEPDRVYAKEICKKFGSIHAVEIDRGKLVSEIMEAVNCDYDSLQNVIMDRLQATCIAKRLIASKKEWMK